MIPPNTVQTVTGEAEHNLEGDVILQPVNQHKHLLMPRSVGKCSKREVPVRVCNPTDKYVTLKKGYHVGYLEEVDEIFKGETSYGADSPVDEQSAGLDSKAFVRRCTVSEAKVLVDEQSAGAGTKLGNPVDEQSAGATGGSEKPGDEQSAGSTKEKSVKEEFEGLPEDTLKQMLIDEIDVIPEHTKDLYARSTTHLDLVECIILAQFITEYADVFAKDDLDLWCCTVLEHEINTGDAKPIRQPMRCTPLGFTDEEDEYLEKMLKGEVIQPSKSDWASPPVLVQKKDGKVRWCVDFRRLNSVTTKDAYPLPLIEEITDSLEGVMYMSPLDVNSGYYQILIVPKDRHKTAFPTKHGLYEFRGLAMGLCNAPATFQRAMQLIFRGMTWKEIITYLDDLNVIGTSMENHLANLRKTFDRIREHNLKLKPKKCCLFQQEVPFLGKVASQQGLSVDPEKIKAVVDWPVPENSRDVESFLGFVNYHCDHIKDFANIAAALYELTGPKSKFDWTERHQHVFETLRNCLVCAPVLAYPNSQDTFILDTDALDKAIGAELLQVQDGVEKVICYGSLSLTPSQWNYCTTQKELLAIVRFTREYRHYLLGQSFIVCTDHSSLTWLMCFKQVEGQLARWLEKLSQFDMTIQHRAGRKHQNADSLSWIPKEGYCNCYEAGIYLDDLPCGGCKYCTKMHVTWSRFEKDVDDAVPLAVRTVRDTG